jgi:hexosaminidase
VQEITLYAKMRGVRVVVELDTPAHTESWGRHSQFKDLVLNCNNIYEGQFDPTLNDTYNLVYHVLNYANEAFEDPYIHFGGDEVEYSCWNKKPSIKEWMNENNISDYVSLSKYYRTRQKAVWRTISKTKKSIYWANEAIDLPL